uniref:RRM domain-containing protein n=1 Tax=Chloropicon roscoffensis TaxID=1461544 RepID=A0A7S2T919_9CHLO|mmetsp:Transcript_287/g.1128  ORF Transcript_287/g.1128 Transcript_287/m.1128 type:complete len:102 (+) Transcript_287:85-390(+)
MDTWQAKWKPPRPVHRNPCLVLGCTDKDALREAFGKFGAVAEVFCPEGQTFGFVTFEDKYDAENAMNALNGTQIGGKTVEVTDGKCANKHVSAWRTSLVKA